MAAAIGLLRSRTIRQRVRIRPIVTGVSRFRRVIPYFVAAHRQPMRASRVSFQAVPSALSCGLHEQHAGFGVHDLRFDFDAGDSNTHQRAGLQPICTQTHLTTLGTRHHPRVVAWRQLLTITRPDTLVRLTCVAFFGRAEA
jgi:hypothetical protein